MSFAVLLMYDYQLVHEELQSLKNEKVIVTENENKQIVSLLFEIKTGKVRVWLSD